MCVSTVIEHKSADHADRNNCIIDWEEVKVVGRECNRNARWIKEAIMDPTDNSSHESRRGV